jgi:activator of HSP90 ATPase
MTYEFTLCTELPAEAKEIYGHWLCSEGHTAMTGAIAHITDEVGQVYDAWDGYIGGKNIELEQDQKIVQSWRTSHFSADDADSIIEIVLEPKTAGTLLTLTHRNVLDEQTSYEEFGWENYYFTPM